MTRHHDKPFTERLLFGLLWASGTIGGGLLTAVIIRQVFL